MGGLDKIKKTHQQVDHEKNIPNSLPGPPQVIMHFYIFAQYGDVLVTSISLFVAFFRVSRHFYDN